MNEHPILFSGEMVRAILDGRKTMTRRVVKPQPYYENTSELCLEDSINNMRWKGRNDWPCPHDCPHGDIGNRLWVREKWAAGHAFDGVPPAHIPTAAKENQKEICLHYAASEDLGGLIRRPSIHMPRWASRITLAITGVRVERLQDISEEDAIAEGYGDMPANFIYPYSNPPQKVETSACDWFSALWNFLNAKRGYGWDANPWVWVVSFMRVPS